MRLRRYRTAVVHSCRADLVWGCAIGGGRCDPSGIDQLITIAFLVRADRLVTPFTVVRRGTPKQASCTTPLAFEAFERKTWSRLTQLAVTTIFWP